MRTPRPAPAARRGGAATVEFAFVALLLLLMLFAILEYCRFLFVYHLATNAARDGARFAAVHTSGGTMAGEPAAVTTADVQGVVRTGTFNNQSYGTGLLGFEGQIENYVCDVYAVPAASLAADPPDMDPTGKPTWNSAPFHEKIAVRITGKYKPVLPSLLQMGTELDFKVTVLVSSEAN